MNFPERIQGFLMSLKTCSKGKRWVLDPRGQIRTYGKYPKCPMQVVTGKVTREGALHASGLAEYEYIVWAAVDSWTDVWRNRTAIALRREMLKILRLEEKDGRQKWV